MKKEDIFEDPEQGKIMLQVFFTFCKEIFISENSFCNFQGLFDWIFFYYIKLTCKMKRNSLKAVSSVLQRHFFCGARGMSSNNGAKRKDVRLLLTKNPARSFSFPSCQVPGISFERLLRPWQPAGSVSGSFSEF